MDAFELEFPLRVILESYLCTNEGEQLPLLPVLCNRWLSIESPVFRNSTSLSRRRRKELDILFANVSHFFKKDETRSEILSAPNFVLDLRAARNC